MPFFLGVDPGYGRMGFGLVEGEKNSRLPSYTTCGIIESDAKNSDAFRLVELEEKLTSVIANYKIELAVVEEVFLKKHLTTGMRLLQARGVILLTLAKHNIEIENINPRRLKKMVAGHGNANKEQIQKMIQNLLKLKTLPKPDDAADALAMSIAAWLSYRQK